MIQILLENLRAFIIYQLKCSEKKNSYKFTCSCTSCGLSLKKVKIITIYELNSKKS
jgi:hypothetical protein